MGIIQQVGNSQGSLYGAFSKGVAFLDDFSAGALLPEWTTLLGTLGYVGGNLQASALTADGNEIVINGTMELDSDWASYNAPTTNERSNVQAHAGTFSRHIVCDALGAAEQGIAQTLGAIIGVTYAFGGWIYLVAGNYAYIILNVTPTATVVAPGSWQQKTATWVATTASPSMKGLAHKTAEAYFDDLTCQMAFAALTHDAETPNVQITAGINMPVAPTVTPRIILIRATDAQDYWRVRVTPNTAGTDTYIEEVVAGVATTRASADVDWTAGAAIDEIRVRVLANNIAVYHCKAGALGWTYACGYATMATGSTTTNHGLGVFATGADAFSYYEEIPL